MEKLNIRDNKKLLLGAAAKNKYKSLSRLINQDPDQLLKDENLCYGYFRAGNMITAFDNTSGSLNVIKARKMRLVIQFLNFLAAKVGA